MRHYRRNTDEGMRELGRAAAAGDAEAAFRLVRRLLGAGQSIDVGLLAQAGPRAMRLLPSGLKAKLVNDLMVEVDVKNLESRVGRSGQPEEGWFPGHRRQDVCPRGHRIGGQNPFIYRNVGGVTEYAYTYEASEDELSVGWRSWDSEHVDGTGHAHVLCTTCNAAWPAGAVDG